MDSATEQILTAALDLPDPDRLELLEALIDSFQASDPIPFDDSWREVVQRRSTELKSGQVDGLSWSEVKRRGREAIGG
jgi:putative addiction module component (TIGR02574 family)